MNKLHVKKGDTVVVLSGVDKGKSGKVLEAFPKRGLVLVEGVGMRRKHQKPRRQGQQGQVVDKHLPIHASNVKAKDAAKKAATPVRAKTTRAKKTTK